MCEREGEEEGEGKKGWVLIERGKRVFLRCKIISVKFHIIIN